MHVAVFNGSPRGNKSNTRLLLEQFCRGLKASGDHDISLTLLLREHDHDLWRSRFLDADFVLLALPLYTDAMPGIVKEFIEALTPLRGMEGLPRFGFLVQSGFPEAAHSRPLERYLEKLVRRLGSAYGGTLVRGGVEGIQIMPPMMTRKLYARTYELGLALGTGGELPPELVTAYAGAERMSSVRRAVFRLLSALGVTNFYWNGQLKENRAYGQRFDRPYDS